MQKLCRKELGIQHKTTAFNVSSDGSIDCSKRDDAKCAKISTCVPAVIEVKVPLKCPLYTVIEIMEKNTTPRIIKEGRA